MDTNSIGYRILDLLDRNHMSQRGLAIQIGITEVSMSRYISGERIPNCITIAKIANSLHTTTDYLLGMDNSDEFNFDNIYRILSKNSDKLTTQQKKEIVNTLF